jgi:glutamate dehydrogenase/leucine dehydrogenase
LQVKQLLFLDLVTLLNILLKKQQLGGKVVTMSDSSGYIYDADGIDAEKLAHMWRSK